MAAVGEDGIRTKRIRSSGNAEYKELRKLLRSAGERREKGLTVLEGEKLVIRFMQMAGEPVQVVYSESAWERRPAGGGMIPAGEKVAIILRDGLFAALSGVKSPSGVLALIRIPAEPVPDLTGPAVMLDGLQDPGNLGSILRSAAAAGIGQGYVSLDTTDPWSPKALRAGMGAHFNLNINRERDLVAAAGRRKGPLLVLDHEAGTSLYDLDLRGDITFLVGSEGRGASREIADAADLRAAIPMPGWHEPLNAAIAAAICFFEAFRQRTAS